MKIGIDIDEVIADQMDQLVKFYHKKTGIHIPKEKYYTQYWPDVWNVPLEEADKLDHEFKNSEFFDNIAPIDGAIASIVKLSKKNEIFMITSRPILFKEKTHSWLNAHLKDTKFQVIHSADFHPRENQKRTKAEICKELGVSVLIEDQDKYSLECANAEIKVILFDCPWNKNAKHSNITRVFSWKEALKVINSIKNA